MKTYKGLSVCNALPIPPGTEKEKKIEKGCERAKKPGAFPPFTGSVLAL